jgi:hypothetical protein
MCSREMPAEGLQPAFGKGSGGGRRRKEDVMRPSVGGDGRTGGGAVRCGLGVCQVSLGLSVGCRLCGEVCVDRCYCCYAVLPTSGVSQVLVQVQAANLSFHLLYLFPLK